VDNLEDACRDVVAVSLLLSSNYFPIKYVSILKIYRDRYSYFNITRSTRTILSLCLVSFRTTGRCISSGNHILDWFHSKTGLKKGLYDA
jgi:hypothetical protein